MTETVINESVRSIFDADQKKLVYKIKVGDECIETLPCMHDVYLIYQDKTRSIEKCLDARQIRKLHQECKKRLPRHFRKSDPEIVFE
jgi:hypothetical protein